jgi:hypothetical protein
LQAELSRSGNELVNVWDEDGHHRGRVEGEAEPDVDRSPLAHQRPGVRGVARQPFAAASRSASTPVQAWSSSEGAPSSPAHTSTTSPPRAAAQAAAAPALMKAATPTAAAPRAAVNALVPLLVVMTIVRPWTRAAVNSSGEFPRSKPSGGSLWRSPARIASGPSAAFRARASSTVSTGTTDAAPLASAVTMVVEARRTSMTSAVAPTRRAGTTPSAVKTTSISTRRHGGLRAPPKPPTPPGEREVRPPASVSSTRLTDDRGENGS